LLGRKERDPYLPNGVTGNDLKAFVLELSISIS